jgi:hypothetical protein
VNARRVRAAEAVVHTAQKTRLTAAGIAAALEAAGMLQSSESAAELVALRDQVAKLEARVEQRTGLLLAVQALARQRGAEAKGREKYGARLKAENRTFMEQLVRGDQMLQERTRELIALEGDRNSWKARVAELESEQVRIEPAPHRNPDVSPQVLKLRALLAHQAGERP